MWFKLLIIPGVNSKTVKLQQIKYIWTHKRLYKLNLQQDYSSILSTMNNQKTRGLNHFEIDNVNKNILTLSRKIK